MTPLKTLYLSSLLTTWCSCSCNAWNNRAISFSIHPAPSSTQLFAGRGKDSAVTTSRVPLTRIFNGEREYLFTTRRNVRNFEWTTAEIEDLFESIISLEEQDELELNAITILPSPVSDEQRHQIGRTSQIYDVHDGQQRLVTLCLLLAALRENLLMWGEEYENDAVEVSKAIFPAKSRLQPVSRIELRDKKGQWLKTILVKNGPGAEAAELKLPKLRQRKQLDPSDRLIVEAYEYLHQRIQEMGPSQALDILLENFMSKVYLLVCIPANTRIARNIVMGLGKGKNLEPVDEFKGMVCFNSIKDESRQDEILNRWNCLCEQVGRQTVESACILFAQIYLRKAVQRNGEMDMMEAFLKKYMNEYQCDGDYIFEKKIVPVSLVLESFRDGDITLVPGSLAPIEELPSLRFLWSACSTIATAKEIELVVLFMLIHWQGTIDRSESIQVQLQLRQLEDIALWMMVTKPKRVDRLQRCFDIMDYCSSTKSLDQISSPFMTSPLELTTEERGKILEILDEHEFGSSRTGSSVAKIILERLNEFEMVHSSQGRIKPIQSTLQLEHVLPQQYAKEWIDWDSTNADEWIHRLGNLVLLTQKVDKKISDSHFFKKKDHLEASPYPLTQQIAKYHSWNVQAVKQHHDTILRQASLVWNLDVSI
jgi:hypothetical protein